MGDLMKSIIAILMTTAAFAQPSSLFQSNDFKNTLRTKLVAERQKNCNDYIKLLNISFSNINVVKFEIVEGFDSNNKSISVLKVNDDKKNNFVIISDLIGANWDSFAIPVFGCYFYRPGDLFLSEEDEISSIKIIKEKDNNYSMQMGNKSIAKFLIKSIDSTEWIELVDNKNLPIAITKMPAVATEAMIPKFINPKFGNSINRNYQLWFKYIIYNYLRHSRMSVVQYTQE